jgi:hypothetical protein
MAGFGAGPGRVGERRLIPETAVTRLAAGLSQGAPKATVMMGVLAKPT